LEKKYAERVKKWREEYNEKVLGIQDEDEDEEEGDAIGSDDDMMEAGDGGDQKKEESSDEEFRPDIDFIFPEEIIVKHGDLDQVLKGYRIENIGL